MLGVPFYIKESTMVKGSLLKSTKEKNHTYKSKIDKNNTLHKHPPIHTKKRRPIAQDSDWRGLERVDVHSLTPTSKEVVS